MATRLTTAAPDIERMLQSLEESRRLLIASSVVAGVVARVADAPREIALALHTRNVADAASLADALDARYFELDEAGDPGALIVFSHARAAMAVKFLLEQSSFEALYEAVIAVDNAEQFNQLVREAVSAAV